MTANVLTALVVGSGGNGIICAVALEKAGIRDYRIITKSSAFGGTWLDNTYPGAAVDIPAVMYQFGQEPNPGWTHSYPAQAEILSYLQSIVQKYALEERTTFQTQMLGAEWDAARCHWRVRTTGATIRARFLIAATGFLEEAVLPDMQGTELFKGRVFHSSRWPAGYTGDGDDVAVIGTGSSAAQIVPTLQPNVRSLTVFQRTPTWVAPKHNRAYTPFERLLFRALPITQRAHRARTLRRFSKQRDRDGYKEMERSLDFLRSQVLDPRLRVALTPDHHWRCKRLIYSTDYWRALNSPNVQLIAEGAEEIVHDGVVSASGTRVCADTVVMTTGFQFGGHILDIVRRRDGLTVAEAQRGRPMAYKSISVSDCPNLFLVGGAGPNSQNMSGFDSGEAASRYIIQMMGGMQEQGISALEVRSDAEAAWKRRADQVLDEGATVRGGCTNYSQDAHGHNRAAWPGSRRHMWRQLSTVEWDAYQTVAPVEGAAPPVGSKVRVHGA